MCASATMTSVFIQCFKPQEAPISNRRVIDRSMIGNPTNFQHTAHIGSNDVDGGSNLKSMESQMQTKGGYGGEACLSHLKLVDVQRSSA